MVRLKDVQRSLDAAVAERDALATRLAEAEANLDRKSLLIKQLQLRNANLEHQLATFVHNSNSAADAASGRDSTANLRPGVSRSDSVASSQQQFEGMFDPEDGEHVRFDVDSPQFHIQVAEREELTAGLKSYLKSLLKEARRFCEHGEVFNRAVASFSTELHRSSSTDTWCGSQPQLAKSLSQFGTTLAQLRDFQEVLFVTLDSTFIRPLDKFINEDVTRAHETAQAASAAHSEFESSLSRYLLLKRSASEATRATRLGDCVNAACRLELARFDTVHALTMLEARKSCVLVEHVCSALYSLRAFYHQAFDCVDELSPSIRALQMALQSSHTKAAEFDNMWSDRRHKLVTELASVTDETALDQVAAIVQRTSFLVNANLVDALHTDMDPSRRAVRSSRPPIVSGSGGAGAGAGVGAGAGAGNVDSPRPFQPSGLPPKTPPSDNRVPGAERDSVGEGRPASDGRPHSVGSDMHLTDIDLSSAAGFTSVDLESPAPGRPSTDSHGSGGLPPSSDMRGGGGIALGAGGGDVTTATGDGAGEGVRLGASAAEMQRARGGSDGASAGAGAGAATDTRRGSSGRGGAGGDGGGTVGATNGAGVGAGARAGAGQPMLVTPTPDPIIKSGYLYKLSSSLRKDWKRRWFYVQSGQLWYIRGPHNMEPVRVADLTLVTVKPYKPDEYRFCMQLHSPKTRTYVLQAHSQAAINSWLDTLRAVTANALVGGGTGSVSSKRGDGGGLAYNARMRRIQSLPGNTVCADCGSAQPDWASLNLGVLICIGCSGSHRGMGVHVSKVRSVTLDEWTPTCMSLLEAIGNTRANRLWEAQPMPGWVKPAPTAPPDSIQKWIENKYQWRGFLAPCDLTPSQLDRSLFAAVEAGNVVAAYEWLCRGADVGWKYSAPDDATDATPPSPSVIDTLVIGCTPLHRAAELGNDTMVELLCQHGASITALDAQLSSALDRAIGARQAAIVELLEEKLRRGEL